MSAGTRLACLVRHHLWRTVCRLSGGLAVRGRWRRPGACVVVANHGSHADTAALMAALPASAEPLFAAASDYWFDDPVRRLLITTLAGGLPVRRTSGNTYPALLAAARPALAQGRAVVIYPEGTRSRDGSVGEFRSGAVRLARDCGVPLVPVALVGTDAVLPKHGRFRPAAMEVRIGEPVDPAAVDAAGLRALVVAARSDDF